MKYAIINDQHFGVNGDSEFFYENYRKFYADIFMPKVKGLDAVLIPGDFWQSRKNINPLTLALAREIFLDPLAEIKMPVYMAYGNHDVYFKNTNKVNTIDFIGKMYSNVEVVETSRELPGGVCLMSWICEDNAVELLKTVENTKSRYLVGHFEVEGHLMTPGHVCVEGLDRALFSRFDKVISGHFHVRGNDGKVFYTSNPSQTTWADYGEEKGFHIFDTDTGELTPVNNPHSVYEVCNWTPETSFEAVKESLANKIVKIVIPSFSSVDLVKFKKFVADATEVSYKLTIVETDKFDGASSLEVQGEVSRLSLRDVVKDYVMEVAPKDIKEACALAMDDLYSRAVKEM